nr:acetyl-CoA hydrolase/transferase C-terminal domain-containing protein [Pedococcus badiiscoriae]
MVRAVGQTAGPAPRVVVSGNAAVPWDLLTLVDTSLEQYRLFMLNAPAGIPTRAGIVHETPFVGPGMRRLTSLRYIPSRLSQVPHLFTTATPPDVVCLHTSAPSGSNVSLGVEVNILPAAIEAARARGALVLAQLNPAMPYTYGDAEIPLSSIDAALWVDQPLGDTPRTLQGHGPPQTGALAQLGRVVSDRVRDGSVLQLGIGRVPDAVLPGLLERRGLGIWSEMISDGVMTLDQTGALSTGRSIVASFVMGSAQLYKWADHNERLRLLRTETTNDPALIARNTAMVSINTALQVDLFGQANASRIAGRIHSGFGGQIDFIEGALHAEGGQALMALQSWHPTADTSTIIAMIDEPVTSFQHTAVITEQGVAEIWGNDEQAQARELIEQAAHPSVRAELWEEARALGLA